MENSRRNFLKKVAYSAPVIVSLGALVKPEDADACLTRSCTNACRDGIHDFRENHADLIRQMREEQTSARNKFTSFIKTHRHHP
jgi:hypothetical protein